MLKKERFAAFAAYLEEDELEVKTELRYENPYELLVAVILSAQCTDRRVNSISPALFATFPSAAHLATAQFDELLPYVKSISYPNNKTKHLLGMSKMLVEEFDSIVPSKIEELQRLPGVGRKTANVIAAVVYNQPTIAVDTHVFRVSKRIGLVTQNAKTPLEVEKQLIRHIPEKHVTRAHHWLILHGRYVCSSRKPKCAYCNIQYFCRYYEKLNV